MFFSKEISLFPFLPPPARKMGDILKTVTVKAVEMSDLSSSSEEVEEEEGEKWDCESILSKYFLISYF